MSMAVSQYWMIRIWITRPCLLPNIRIWSTIISIYPQHWYKYRPSLQTTTSRIALSVSIVPTLQPQHIFMVNKVFIKPSVNFLYLKHLHIRLPWWYRNHIPTDFYNQYVKSLPLNIHVVLINNYFLINWVCKNKSCVSQISFYHYG